MFGYRLHILVDAGLNELIHVGPKIFGSIRIASTGGQTHIAVEHGPFLDELPTKKT